MVEQLRDIYAKITIDTNKRTEEYELTTANSVPEVIEAFREWASVAGFWEDPDAVTADPTPPQPERWLRGARTFARSIGTCPRCRGPVQAVLTVAVTVDLNEMYWNERSNRPSVGASSKIVDTKVEHVCSDSDPDEEDEM